MHDQIITVGGSRLQHGPANDRVYLMHLDRNASPDTILQIMDALVNEHHYSKLFAKVPVPVCQPFLDQGYQIEARVPGFFGGVDEGLFMVRYHSPARQQRDARASQADQLLAQCLAVPRTSPSPLPEAYTLRRVTEDDLSQVATLYRTTFASYPFPIFDPDFLRQSQREGTLFAGIWYGSQLLAVASAEVEAADRNAELTDFATAEAARGQGLAGYLLAHLEQEARAVGVTVGYTIARALSPGMNKTFARAGYHHGGTLINNTQIGGQLETMQVWHKAL